MAGSVLRVTLPGPVYVGQGRFDGLDNAVSREDSFGLEFRVWDFGQQEVEVSEMRGFAAKRPA